MANFHLLLNILFHDQPRWAFKAYSTFKTFDAFTENLIQNLHKLSIPETHHDTIKKIIESYDEHTHLNKLKQHNIALLTIDDDNYPELLKEISDPPILLYTKGNTAILSNTQIAVVGARQHTPYAADATKHIVSELCHYVTITSGLAIGIDSIAHSTAISENQPTIGVVANGLDIIYPKQNASLYKKLEASGCIISEHPPGTEVMPYYFHQRNRIISGLSKGTLVCQAASKSGTLITARFATEQNRDVFAIPGPIIEPLSEGPHRLIQDGAKLVHSVQDILEELHLKPQKLPFKKMHEKPTIPSGLSSIETTILEIINNQASNLDDLTKKSEKPIQEILQVLTLLEVKGLITKNGPNYIAQ